MDPFARPLEETEEDRLRDKCDQLQNDNRLAHGLLNATRKLVDAQAAEIERLTAELELAKKVRDQAIEFAELQIAPDGFLESTGAMSRRMAQEKMSELYAHLGGGK